MLFNSFPFWIFFALVAAAYFTVPARMAAAVLVAASFLFYASYNPSLLLLLAGCIGFNFLSGLAIGRSEGRQAKAALAIAISANLIMLGFFKYYGFVIGSLSQIIPLPRAIAELRVVLPVAISFYTFEAISYNVDIYRRVLPPRRNLLDFAVFISFFPHLVAGPIIRPAHFFPQMQGRPVPNADDLRWSAVQIIKGLIKKMVFADNFALIANEYFDRGVGHAGMLAAWIGVVAFSMQIYCDFSGYTDIARGCARILGYQFPPNFERPYLSADIGEFWRRWHISLSSWLRDYLYFPLGGSRRSAARTYLNLMLTMGLGGLWHGASWNFLAWGLYHGVLLSAHRFCREHLRLQLPPGGLGRVIGVTATFLCVTLGWVAFRAPDFSTGFAVLREMFLGAGQSGWPGGASPLPSFLVLTGASLIWTALDRGRRLQTWLSEGAGLAGTVKVSAAFALSFLVLELFASADSALPFIYFRF